MNEIEFDKEGRDKLINGINKLNKAVSSTLGPMGKTVIIPDKDNPNSYKVTKDGVSVANSIRFKDPVEDIGAELIKQAAQKTVDEAGDGTTTSTVLATAFVNNLKNFNSKEINKAFDDIIPKVISELRKNSRQLKHEDIKYVATISANNDTEIGDLIQQAYNFSSIIKIEEFGLKDSLECIEGMSLPVSYFSKRFITNDKKGEVDMIEPYVLVLDGKLEKLDSFKSAIEYIAANNKELLIITEHVHEAVLRNIESNISRGSLKCCVIKSPGFSKHRKDLLEDLSKFTGATIITDLSKNYNVNILGKLKSATISKDRSILVKHEDINIDEVVNSLKEYSNILNDKYEKELLDQRISNLTGKVSIIKVGGRSEIEVKERKDRYDDAVLAVACALEEGIVEGAGKALIEACKIDDFLIKLNKEPTFLSIGKNLSDVWSVDLDSIEGSIIYSLFEPYNTIQKNGCDLYIVKDLFKENIIDPLKVTRCALENAVSVAKTILSTEAIVLSHFEWNK